MARGGWFITPRLIRKPVATVSAGTANNAISKGATGGAKLALKTNTDNAHAAPVASRTPVSDASKPSAAYSTNSTRKICPRDAPSVPAAWVSRGSSCVITDSIEQGDKVLAAKNIRIVPTAPVFAQAILNIWGGMSVSSLFETETLTPIYEGYYPSDRIAFP